MLTDSFLRERNSPYVVTSIAKGGTRRWVLVREVFRNASLPALTIAGVILGNLVAAAVIVETIYSRAGMGRLAEMAVSTKDIPVIQGIVVVTATLFAVLAGFVVGGTVGLVSGYIGGGVEDGPRRPHLRPPS